MASTVEPGADVQSVIIGDCAVTEGCACFRVGGFIGSSGSKCKPGSWVGLASSLGEDVLGNYEGGFVVKHEMDKSNGEEAIPEGLAEQAVSDVEVNMRVVAYVRANIRRDRNDDLLDAQKETLQRLADETGYTIVDWYADVGVANPKVGALARLLEDAAAPGRDWNCVVVESSSRLFGLVNDRLYVQGVLREHGIEVVSDAEGDVSFLEDGLVIEIMRAFEDHCDEAMASRRRARRA